MKMKQKLAHLVKILKQNNVLKEIKMTDFNCDYRSDQNESESIEISNATDKLDYKCSPETLKQKQQMITKLPFLSPNSIIEAARNYTIQNIHIGHFKKKTKFTENQNTVQCTLIMGSNG